jgi:hypothetical protein
VKIGPLPPVAAVDGATLNGGTRDCVEECVSGGRGVHVVSELHSLPIFTLKEWDSDGSVDSDLPVGTSSFFTLEDRERGRVRASDGGSVAATFSFFTLEATERGGCGDRGTTLLPRSRPRETSVRDTPPPTLVGACGGDFRARGTEGLAPFVGRRCSSVTGPGAGFTTVRGGVGSRSMKYLSSLVCLLPSRVPLRKTLLFLLFRAGEISGVESPFSHLCLFVLLGV